MKPFLLDNRPKIEPGFKVPENYFDDFSAKFMAQLPENEPKVIAVFAKRKSWFYAAAAVFILTISIPATIYFNQQKQLDSQDLENYLAANNSISETELISNLEEKDIKKIKIDLKIEDKTIENELISSDDLENYLIN